MRPFILIIRQIMFLLLPVILISCNIGEGSGGSGVIEGTVYKVLHPDDNFNLETDTVRAGMDGVFAFQKLSPGDYTVFTLSEDEDDIPSVVSKTVSVTETDQIYWLSDTIRVNVRP